MRGTLPAPHGPRAHPLNCAGQARLRTAGIPMLPVPAAAPARGRGEPGPACAQRVPVHGDSLRFPHFPAKPAPGAPPGPGAQERGLTRLERRGRSGWGAPGPPGRARRGQPGSRGRGRGAAQLP